MKRTFPSWSSFFLLILLPVVGKADWTASGRFNYTDRTYDLSGFTGTMVRPVREADVQVYDQATMLVLASGATDANGEFSILVPDELTRTAAVRVLADTTQTASLNFSVVDDANSDAVYSYNDPTTDVPLHLPLTDVDFGTMTMPLATGDVGSTDWSSQVFNTFDMGVLLADWIASVDGARPSVAYSIGWNPVNGRSGSFYNGGSNRFSMADDDGYDDPNILHELGHYVEDEFGFSKNIGGSHSVSDDDQDPRLAFSEGFATYVANATLLFNGRPRPDIYSDRDSFSTGSGSGFAYSLESNASGGSTQEEAVNAALYDLIDSSTTEDDTNTTDDDSISGKQAEIWAVIEEMRVRSLEATSFEDFWDIWRDLELGNESDLQTIFATHSIDFKADAQEPNDTPATATSLTVDGAYLENTFYRTGDTPSGDEDWFSFSATQGSHYRIQVDGSANAIFGRPDPEMFLMDPFLDYVLAYSDDPLDQSLNDQGDPSAQDMEETVPSVLWRAPSTGTFHVLLRHASQERNLGGRYGTYQIRVAEVTAPTPAVTSVASQVMLPGETYPILIVGDHFEVDATVTVGDGNATLSDVRWISEEVMSANLQPGIMTADGDYSLTVTNPGGETGTLSAAFAVNASAQPPLSITEVDLGSSDRVEIRNNGTVSATLTGWKIVGRDDTATEETYTFSTFTLGAGDTVVVHDDAGTDTATDLYDQASGFNWPWFGEGTGDVSLVDDSNRNVDYLRFVNSPTTGHQAPVGAGAVWMQPEFQSPPETFTISRGALVARERTGFGLSRSNPTLPEGSSGRTNASDAEENNDEAGRVRILTRAETLSGLGISERPGAEEDVDWYGVLIDAGDSVDITAQFTHASGDLTLEVYPPGETATPLSTSASSTDNEVVQLDSSSTTSAGGGIYRVKVFGVGGAVNSYSLVLSGIVNVLPTITDIADQSTVDGTATSAVGFTVGDTETAAASLTLSGNSSDQSIVPDGNIVFGGSGASRTVAVTPLADKTGTVTITVTVTDGDGATAFDDFVLTVTADPDKVEYYVWDAVSGPQGVNIGVPVTVTAKNAFDATVTGFSGTVTLSGVQQTNTVVISEIDPGNTDQVEFTNVSGEPQDVSNWQVVLYDVNSFPSPLTKVTIPDGSTLAAGAVFTIVESGTAPGTFPSLEAGNSVNWDATQTEIAVALLNDAGELVDFVTNDDSTMITDPVIIPSAHWSGSGFALSTFPNTFQRSGGADSNSKVDWSAGSGNVGTFNSGMTVPFESVEISVSPATSGSFSSGVWTGNVSVLAEGRQVVLTATDGSGNAGSSNPFDVEIQNDLSIGMTSSVENLRVGESVTYTITVTQTGPGSATGVTVTDDLPAALTFVSVVTSQGSGSETDGEVTANLGDLDAGASATVVITATANASGTVENTATLTRGEMDPVTSNNAVSVSVVVVDGPDNIEEFENFPGFSGTLSGQEVANDTSGMFGFHHFGAGATTDGGFQVDTLQSQNGRGLHFTASEDTGMRNTEDIVIANYTTSAHMISFWFKFSSVSGTDNMSQLIAVYNQGASTVNDYAYMLEVGVNSGGIEGVQLFITSLFTGNEAAGIQNYSVDFVAAAADEWHQCVIQYGSASTTSETDGSFKLWIDPSGGSATADMSYPDTNFEIASSNGIGPFGRYGFGRSVGFPIDTSGPDMFIDSIGTWDGFGQTGISDLGSAIEFLDSAVEAVLDLAVSDANKAEGDSGDTSFTFTVSRTGNTVGTSSADYSVSGTGTAPADASDFGGSFPSGTVSFVAGETSKTITINVSGDTLGESNEKFLVTLSNPSSLTTFGSFTATGTIQNDDTSVVLAAASADKAEGNSGTTDFTFTVTRSGLLTGTSTVDYEVSSAVVSVEGNGEGASEGSDGDDFGGSFPSGAVSFAASETSKTITISVTGDTDVEPDEEFEVTLSNPSGTTITTDTAIGTIRNDDASLAIAATSADKIEGDSGTTSFTFTVTRSGDTTGTASADYSVAGDVGTPADAADFGGSFPNGTVSFAGGETSQVITIPVSGDTDVEPDEGFAITLGNPTGATITTASAVGTIRNEDASLSIAATSADKVEEDLGNVTFTFTVVRSGDSSGTASVDYAVTGNGADPADANDFGGTFPSGTVNFAGGETTQVIMIDVSGDLDVEMDEGFVVTLGNPTGATLVTATALGTIRNDDTTLVITASSADKAELDSDASAFTFTVTRSGDVTGASTAGYAVSGDGANPADADDFGGTFPSGTVNFAGGETEKTVSILVGGDVDVEPDEGFVVTLGNPTGTTITTASASGTIQNDDTGLAISASSADKAEGDSGNTTFTFTVTRSGDTSGSASADYAVMGDGVSPSDVDDFGGTFPSGAVNFADGETSQVITIDVSGDIDVETDEGFIVTLSNPSGTTLSVAGATGTIRNDDSGLSIAAASADKTEGDSGNTGFTFTVTRTGNSSGAASANFMVLGQGEDPVNGDDFGGSLPSGTVNFADGETSIEIMIDVSADTEVEPDEGFEVNLSGASGATILTSTANGTVRNDDTTVSVTPTSADRVEGDTGTSGFAFTVTRSGELTGSSSVDYSVSGNGGSPADAGDFGGAFPSGTVNFAGGESSQVITVDVFGDTDVEPDEGFIVTLSNPSGTTITVTVGMGVIRNDDTSLSIAATSAVKAEGDSGTTDFTFTVTRSGVLTGVASVDFGVSGASVAAEGTSEGGGDQADGDDFGGAFPNGMVSFADGESIQVITIQVSGDTDVEQAESFVVTLSNASGAGLVGDEATGTILNDDASLSIAATSADKVEGSSGSTAFTFTVTRSGDTSGSASADYAVVGDGGNPADTDDFGGAFPSGAVNFAVGETSQVITINVSGDMSVESDEGFVVTLSNSSAATITMATATGNIQNDDASLAIAATSADKAEGDTGTTSFAFTVTRSGDTSGSASAEYAVTGNGGDPTDAADFGGTFPSGAVNFAGGETSQVITINVSGDVDVEMDEGFVVTLSNPTGTTITTDTATGNIQNDDASLAIAATSADKDEGDSGSTAFTFTVIRSGDTSGSASADYAVVGDGGNPADTDDFGGAFPSGAVNFAGGETSQVITINVSGDVDVEMDEGFVVTLSNPTRTTITTDTATGNIQNDDASLAIAATSADKAEGDTGTTSFTFTVTRSGDTSGSASADYSVMGDGGTPADAGDFGGTFPSGAVNFAGGETSQVITIDVSGDVSVESDEGFVVTLSDPTGATITTDTATGGIRNDDASLSITATSADKAEGDSGSTAFTFTVARTGDTSGSASADYSVMGDGGNPADAADFGGTLPSGSVNFAAGETTQVITIDVSGDTDVEPDEGFVVTLSNPTAATISTATVTGNIQNDDASLAIAATSADKAEGDTGTTSFAFTVIRSGDTSGSASVDYVVTGDGGTPADADDFGGTFPSGAVNFAGGETSQVITIDVSGDVSVESDEGFVVTLSDPTGATITTDTETGTILNDDASLSIAATSADKDEGDSGDTAFTFTVTRSGDTSGSASAEYAVTGNGGDPADAADFGGTLPSGSVNFAGGETSQVITIDVSGDTDVEPDEGFVVTLSNPTAATISTAAATGNIQNDDASLVITATSTDKAEGDTGTTSFTFTVTRSGDTSGSASADYSVMGDGGTPADADDFGGTFPSGAVNFAGGETSQVITIDVSGDVSVESDEGFVVTLSDPTGATVAPDTATGVIQNDDASLSITATSADKAEGDSGSTAFTFTVTRNGDTSGSASADYSVMGDGGNPADAADFGGTLPSGSVNFAAGETTQVITIDVSGDTDVEPDEGFHLMLSNPSGATLSLAGALGIIRNDDLILSEAVASSVFRLLPSTHLPGETFEVVLAAEPASDINTWTVTEQLPSGAAPDAISHNGNFNSEEGIITWGPFDDVALRTLSYRVVLNMAVGEVGVFGGTASFDGEGVLVGGQNSTEAVSEIGNPRLSDIVFLPRDEIAFTVPVVNGKEYQVQVSSDLMVWVPIETKTASGGSITVIDDSTDKPAIRFYRVVEVGSP